MKRTLLILTLAIAALATPIARPAFVHAQRASVSIQFFYDNLSPYGHWVHHPVRGYVWLPIVEPDFVPYATQGHWVWTEYGWAWVSDYPWGWAPFHYGRWDYDDDFGWYWSPDVEWAPAWVVWNRAPGYYGWAPMRPGIVINIILGGGYHPPWFWWTFCHDKYFGRRHIRNHYVSRRDNERILGESRVIEQSPGDNGRSKYLSGPNTNDVKATTGRSVSTVKIEDNAKPGEMQSGTVWKLYRPSVEQVATGAATPVPRKIETPTQVAPPTRGQSSRPPTEVVAPSTRSPVTPVPTPQRKSPTSVPNTNQPGNRQSPRTPAPTQAPKPSQSPTKVPQQQAPRPDVRVPSKPQPTSPNTPRSVPKESPRQVPKEAPAQVPQKGPNDAPKQNAPSRHVDPQSPASEQPDGN